MEKWEYSPCPCCFQGELAYSHYENDLVMTPQRQFIFYVCPHCGSEVRAVRMGFGNPSNSEGDLKLREMRRLHLTEDDLETLPFRERLEALGRAVGRNPQYPHSLRWMWRQAAENMTASDKFYLRQYDGRWIIRSFILGLNQAGIDDRTFIYDII